MRVQECYYSAHGRTKLLYIAGLPSAPTLRRRARHHSAEQYVGRGVTWQAKALV